MAKEVVIIRDARVARHIRERNLERRSIYNHKSRYADTTREVIKAGVIQTRIEMKNTMAFGQYVIDEGTELTFFNVRV